MTELHLAFLPSQEAAIKELIQRSSGIALVSGADADARTLALEYVARSMRSHDRMRVSVVALPGAFRAPPESIVPMQPGGDRMVSAVRYAMYSDPDALIVDPIDAEGAPLLARTGAEAARWGIGVWASIEGSAADKALARLAGFFSEGFDPWSAGLLSGLFHVAKLPRLCAVCSQPGAGKVSGEYSNLFEGHGSWRERGAGCDACLDGIKGAEVIGEIIVLPGSGKHAAPAPSYPSPGLSALAHALARAAEGVCEANAVLDAFGPLPADPLQRSALMETLRNNAISPAGKHTP